MIKNDAKYVSALFMHPGRIPFEILKIGENRGKIGRKNLRKLVKKLTIYVKT